MHELTSLQNGNNSFLAACTVPSQCEAPDVSFMSTAAATTRAERQLKSLAACDRSVSARLKAACSGQAALGHELQRHAGCWNSLAACTGLPRAPERLLMYQHRLASAA